MAHESEHTKTDQLIPIGSVVARLQRRYPEISHSSLRFLEREGVILPSRTPGGHRLYSEADISRIVQVKEWQQQHLPLGVIRERLREMENADDLPALMEAFIERGLAGRFLGAGKLLVEANDRGVPMLALFADVLEPALVEVGNRWAEQTLLVSQEKQFSETAREVIAELSQRYAWIDPARSAIIAACVQGNLHELGLRMIVGALRSEGWPVHFLGADVAPTFLLEAIHLYQPRLILLSIDMPEHALALQSALDVIQSEVAENGDCFVVVGGRMASAPESLLAPYGEMVIHGDGLRDVFEKVQRFLNRISSEAGS